MSFTATCIRAQGLHYAAACAGSGARVSPRTLSSIRGANLVLSNDFPYQRPTNSSILRFLPLVENHLEWDLSIALVLPLLMVMSVARSVDPRVGQGPGGAQRCDRMRGSAPPEQTLVAPGRV